VAGAVSHFMNTSAIPGPHGIALDGYVAGILGGKKREYLKDKIDELATNSKNKNIADLYRGINDFKRGYQPRSNLVTDENGDLLANYHILNRWKNAFPQLMNVQRVSDVRQIEIHTTEPLVPDSSHFELKLLL
jgi:hypothetical protein